MPARVKSSESSVASSTPYIVSAPCAFTDASAPRMRPGLFPARALGSTEDAGIPSARQSSTRLQPYRFVCSKCSSTHRSPRYQQTWSSSKLIFRTRFGYRALTKKCCRPDGLISPLPNDANNSATNGLRAKNPWHFVSRVPWCRSSITSYSIRSIPTLLKSSSPVRGNSGLIAAYPARRGVSRSDNANDERPPNAPRC
jgi:hypothetical protein